MKVPSENVVSVIDVAHNTAKLLEAVDDLAAVNNIPGNSPSELQPSLATVSSRLQVFFS